MYKVAKFLILIKRKRKKYIVTEENLIRILEKGEKIKITWRYREKIHQI